MTPRSRTRSQPTRDRILAAARASFAQDGFDRTTVRSVAAVASCNPALVIRYYGSKEGLFAAATTFDLELPDLSEIPFADLGEELVAHFLNRWERSLDENELVTLLRAAVGHEGARAKMAVIFENQLSIAVAQVCDATTASARATLIASSLLGLGLIRYVLRLPEAVALQRTTIVAALGVTIQRYLESDDVESG